MTDVDLAKRPLERVDVDELIVSFDDLSKRVARYGGLFRFMEARAQGLESDIPIETPARPMTIVEKILSRHMKTRHGAVRPGDAGFIHVDAGFSHDYTTAPTDAMIRGALGGPTVKNPSSIHAFPDHLTLASDLQESREALTGIRPARGQRRLKQLGIQLHANARAKLRGFATIVREEIAWPGQVILERILTLPRGAQLPSLRHQTPKLRACGSTTIAGRVPTRSHSSQRPVKNHARRRRHLHLAREGKTGIFTGKVMGYGQRPRPVIFFRRAGGAFNMAVRQCAPAIGAHGTDDPLSRRQARRIASDVENAGVRGQGPSRIK